MPSATTSSLRAGCVALLVLGLVDLGVLNFYLAPAAFPPTGTEVVESPEPPGGAQTPSQSSGVTDPETPPADSPSLQTPPPAVATASPSEGEEVGGEEGAGAGGNEGAGAREAPAPPSIPRKTVILFGTAEHQLSVGAKRQVDRLLAKLALAPAVTEIRIEGHADKRGESTFNRALSAKRAQAVAEYLAEKGVAQGKLSSKGLGDQFPLNQGETTAALARNRRVEIIIPQGER